MNFQSQITLVMYPFPEKSKTVALVDSIGSSGVDVVMELQETRYGVVISAAKEESKGGEEFGFLDAEFFE